MTTTYDFSSVSFARRTEECSECGMDYREGYYYTDDEEGYEIRFVCGGCREDLDPSFIHHDDHSDRRLCQGIGCPYGDH